MQKHLKTLGIIYIVESILGMIIVVPVAFLMFTASGEMLIFDTIPISSSSFAIMLFFINFIICIILFYYGISAVSLDKWTTGIIGYIFAIFQLVSFPIGTAIALYSFWILTKIEMDREYD